MGFAVSEQLICMRSLIDGFRAEGRNITAESIIAFKAHSAYLEHSHIYMIAMLLGPHIRYILCFRGAFVQLSIGPQP